MRGARERCARSSCAPRQGDPLMNQPRDGHTSKPRPLSSLRLLGTSVLAGIAGALFSGLVAQAVGVSVALAAGVSGPLMAALVAFVIVRDQRRAA